MTYTFRELVNMALASKQPESGDDMEKDFYIAKKPVDDDEETRRRQQEAICAAEDARSFQMRW